MSNDIVIEGRLTKKLDPISGQGRNGTWQKREFIIELQSNYPTSVCIELWGERISEIDKFNDGDTIQAHVDISSREYNGRWYTSIRAWKIESAQAEPATQQNPSPIPETAKPATTDLPPIEDSSEDDLPF